MSASDLVPPSASDLVRLSASDLVPPSASDLVRLDVTGAVARLTLARPARHNALVPELVDGLVAALDRIAGASLDALVLAADGRSFSTGGDLAGFAAVPRGERRAYADRLVGGLNRAILALIELPFPTIARVQGPVTGGALGLVLACDLAAMSRTAFLAPYYVAVGFAPDGGWTALLPDRIGTARAREIQLLNRHVGADEAARLGIVTAAVDPEALDPTVDGWLATLAGHEAGAILATRELLMPAEATARVAARLAAEKARFLDMVDEAAVDAGLARFLNAPRIQKVEP